MSSILARRVMGQAGATRMMDGIRPAHELAAAKGDRGDERFVDGRSLMVGTVPVPRLLEPGAQRVDRVEPEARDFGEIVGTVRLSIGLRRIPLDSSVHAGKLSEDVDDL